MNFPRILLIALVVVALNAEQIKAGRPDPILQEQWYLLTAQTTPDSELSSNDSDGSLDLYYDPNQENIAHPGEQSDESQEKSLTRLPLDYLLDLMAHGLSSLLPYESKPGYYFDKVLVEENTLVYEISLLNFERSNFDKAVFLRENQSELTGHVCETELTRLILQKGGVVSARYFDTDGNSLRDLTIQISECS